MGKVTEVTNLGELTGQDSGVVISSATSQNAETMAFIGEWTDVEYPPLTLIQSYRVENCEEMLNPDDEGNAGIYITNDPDPFKNGDLKVAGTVYECAFINCSNEEEGITVVAPDDWN